jgi:hypothetical protein
VRPVRAASCLAQVHLRLAGIRAAGVSHCKITIVSGGNGVREKTHEAIQSIEGRRAFHGSFSSEEESSPKESSGKYTKHYHCLLPIRLSQLFLDLMVGDTGLQKIPINIERQICYHAI